MVRKGNGRWWCKNKTTRHIEPCIQKMINEKIIIHVTYVMVLALQTYCRLQRMTKLFRCKYCTRTFPSMQGQRSHVAQARKCHERWQADLDTMLILPPNLFEGRSGDN